MKAIAAVFFLLASTGIHAQSLWKESRVGMTVQDVQSAFPEAHAPADPQKLHDGSGERLELDGVDLVSQKFKALFYFRGEGLSQVTLKLQDEASAKAAELVYDRVSVALRSKYGAEVEHSEKHGMMEMRAATWMSGPTNISVLYNAIGNSDPLLNINYQVRISSDARNL